MIQKQKQIFILLFSLMTFLFGGNIAHATENLANDYRTYSPDISARTFNEYRYKIAQDFFELKKGYEIFKIMDTQILNRIKSNAEISYKYLPVNLQNTNIYSSLITELERGILSPDDQTIVSKVRSSIGSYLDNTDINSITADISASPVQGNAPLSVTLRAKATEPSGSDIPDYNYTWWMDKNGKKVVLGRGVSYFHTFKEEGNYAIFLDVVSSHRNQNGNIDVLPFRGRVDIKATAKIADMNVRVNGEKVENGGRIKFTPADAEYGIMFDPSSSVPTEGTIFEETTWDFGNGITRTYKGGPNLERVQYIAEKDYNVKLRIKTNQGEVLQHNFTLGVFNPAATIKVGKTEGYLGDTFSFTPKAVSGDSNFGYDWEVYDIDRAQIVTKKSGRNFNHTFTEKGRYTVKMNVSEPTGDKDTDTVIISINSREPVGSFNVTVPESHKPNTVFIDGSASYDPDLGDTDKLLYDWYLDGAKIRLNNASKDQSQGYYTFNSTGSHELVLIVRDPDGLSSEVEKNIKIDSILSLDFEPVPRIIQRNQFMQFRAVSEHAEVFDWNYGDGVKEATTTGRSSHKFTRSGFFDVVLTVTDDKKNTNSYSQRVFVGESDKPVAFFDVKNQQGNKIVHYDENACDSGAFIIDRVNVIHFSGSESVNTDGTNTGMDYSWKIGNDTYYTTADVNQKFDEIGCFPVKLTVRNQENGKSDTYEKMVEVKNLKPTLSTLNINVTNPDGDPLIVDVTAVNAQDPDGVIQSYLWYYYTDTDTEPQGFRSTTGAATRFVIPKITGNYYFVVVLKDNNEERITSEEIFQNEKFYTTVTGNNANTPIVELSASDTNAGVGEEIIFQAVARDILNQNIEKDSVFSWDFDGDGFYDKESKTSKITHKYTKSGDFKAKVKVKHKGISTVRTVGITISNKLDPSFDVISLGNNYLFFDTSSGKIDSRKWELPGGVTKTGKTFMYDYMGDESDFEVTLTIAEGTKTKEVTKTVKKNIKNIMALRQMSLPVFSSPAMGENNTITLKKETQSAFIYLTEPKTGINAIGVDYDIEVDEDINGVKDDDLDNKDTVSFKKGGILEIPLNSSRRQKIRVFTLDNSSKVVNSVDITILKEYIEDIQKDISGVEFTGVTEEEKAIIDKLKVFLDQLPEDQRNTSFDYIKRMQENWSDDTEKTRILIEFEGYILDNAIEKQDEIYELLDSLLVIGQDDKSEKAVLLNALKNLIPASITCSTGVNPQLSCKQELETKLDIISESPDLEERKKLGSEILKEIGSTQSMSVQQQLDFKAFLQTLIYSGIDNIPTDIKEEVVDTPSPGAQPSKDSSSILMTILKYLGIFLLIAALVAIVYYIVYLIKRKKDQSFKDYVGEKTGDPLSDALSDDSAGDTGDSDGEVNNGADDNIDPLAQTTPKKDSNNSKDNAGAKESSGVPDWLSGISGTSEEDFENKDTKNEDQKKNDAVNKQNKDEKTSAESDKNVSESSSKSNDTNTGDNQENELSNENAIQSGVPDWLKSSFDDSSSAVENKQENAPEKTTPEKTTPEKTTTNKIADTNNTGSKSPASDQSKDIEPNKSADQNKSNKNEEDIDKVTSLEDNSQIPDWLKGTINTDTQKPDTVSDKNDEVETTENNKVENTNKQISQDKSKNTADNQKELKPGASDNAGANNAVKSEIPKDIPDWLKGSFETDKSPSGNDTKNTENIGAKADAAMPDWLKASVETKSSNTPKKSSKPKSPSNTGAQGDKSTREGVNPENDNLPTTNDGKSSNEQLADQIDNQSPKNTENTKTQSVKNNNSPKSENTSKITNKTGEKTSSIKGVNKEKLEKKKPIKDLSESSSAEHNTNPAPKKQSKTQEATNSNSKKNESKENKREKTQSKKNANAKHVDSKASSTTTKDTSSKKKTKLSFDLDLDIDDNDKAKDDLLAVDLWEKEIDVPDWLKDEDDKN